MLLAYSIVTVLLFSHNSAVKGKSKNIIKPISSCIASQHKLTCENYPKVGEKSTLECFGITPNAISDIQIVYDQLPVNDNDETILDSDTAISILQQAVQQSIVLNSMKAFNSCKQMGMYSILFKCVKDWFDKQQITDTPHNNTLLDNLLDCNSLQRVIVPGDGNCCFYQLQWA